MTDRPERSLFERAILVPAIGSSFAKLDPRLMVRNPVMFVVEVGAVLTTRRSGSCRRSAATPPGGGDDPAWFTFAVALWLWFTVLFANFAEAIAEGRGKAQADSLRAMRTETVARLRDGGTRPATELRRGDVVVVEAGEVIPGDGTVIEGIASVDESAITGESAPVIRESGGDRSAVTGGTRVLSDHIVVEITQEPGPVVPGPHDRARRGVGAAQDAERDRALDPARRPDDHVPRGRRDAAAVRRVRGNRHLDHDPDRAAGRADPDHDRRAAERDRHRRHGPAGAPQRARAVRPRGRGVRRRRRAAARQDRHDHARQPPGRRLRPDARRRGGRAGRGGAVRVAGRRDARGSLDRRARQAVRHPRARAAAPARRVRAVHRADADERRRPQRHATAQGRRRRDHPVGRRRGRPRAARARARARPRGPPGLDAARRRPRQRRCSA